MLISVKLIACSALCGLSAGAFWSAQAKHAEAGAIDLQKDYNTAQHLQQAGNSDAAARAYRAFLNGAVDELAAGHAHIGDYARAATLFEEAVQLQPGSPALRLDYARNALLMGDTSRVETITRAFLSNGHGNSAQLADAHQILGRALLKENKDQEAKNEMSEALKLDPSFANGYGLAVACLDLDDEKCASQVFQEMQSSFGDTPALHMQIGLAYGNSDFVPQAIAQFKKVIAEDPRFPAAHYSLAAALLTAGNDATNVPEAEAELKKELEISPHDYLTYAALGKLAVADHQYTDAEGYLKQATSLNTGSPDAFLYLGQMYFDTNRPVDAETALRKAIQLTRDPSANRFQIQKAHFLLGRALMQQHRSEEAHAEMDLARAFANEGLSHDKSELSGLLHNSGMTGDDETSRTPAPVPDAVQNIDPAALSSLNDFEKKLTPAIADSYNNLGAMEASGKRYIEAINYFERAAVWDPSLDGIDLNWGRATFLASRFAQAIPPLTRYVSAHPEDTGTRGALAMSQFMTGDYSGCVHTFASVEDKLASIPQMQYAFAESLVRTGQIAGGKARLESLESTHPEIADVHRALGEVYDLERDMPMAERELKMAIVLNASDPEAHFDLGKVDVESGNAQGAVSELETATRLFPSDPAFHRELAAAYNLASRGDDARKERNIYEKLKSQSVAQDQSATPEAKTESGK